jgi:nucleoid DNA-binding protein
MNREKISSQEIIDLVAQKASISKRAAEEFLKVMIGTIEEALLAGEIVKIKNFGTFKLHWNEPRKSVNVQTGENIIIEGYYKVNFIPENNLKELVNEPFGHLEPVNIDEELPEQTVFPTEEALDPLRIFTEQATEIRNLISEINSLSNDNEALPNEIVAEKSDIDQDEDDLEVDLIIDEETAEPEIINDNFVEVINESEDEPEDSNYSLQQPIAMNQELQIDNTEIKPAESAFSDNIISLNKKKRKFWIPILILLIMGTSFGLYFFYLPANQFVDNSYTKTRSYLKYMKENMSVTDIVNSISKSLNSDKKSVRVPSTIVIPKDTMTQDSIESKQPVDSLQILFDNPRIYKEFIDAEQIKSGSRLALMSLRYYGSKDFWVYIYEANMSKITNPDRIPTGTLIRIPKLDPRLIDLSNPRCLKKAKELHDLYIK